MAEDAAGDDLAKAFNDAIAAETASVGTQSVSAAAMPDDAKRFFCANWPMIKQVLQFLGDKIGGIGGLAVKGLIAAGDILHGKICT